MNIFHIHIYLITTRNIYQKLSVEHIHQLICSYQIFFKNTIIYKKKYLSNYITMNLSMVNIIYTFWFTVVVSIMTQ